MKILSLLLRRPQMPAVRSEQAILLEDMESALRRFTQAMKKYDADLGISFAYSQMLFAEVEVHREAYYLARLQYESSFGDLTNYNECLVTLQKTTKERDIPCLFKHPHELYA